MDPKKQKEEFSLAYVRVIAAKAGCGSSTPTPDDKSVDIQLNRSTFIDSPEIVRSDPEVGIQAKCTATKSLKNGRIAFPLPIKNYNDLRKTKLCVPRILVVHLVPAEEQHWLLHSEEEMVVRQCSYWVSLKGMPEMTNTTSVTVRVPQTNVFNPNGLLAIMERIERGEPL